jgi:hypothetical protein
MNLGYLIQQAERTPSRAEQQAADAMRGELARTVSGLLRPRRHGRLHRRRDTDRPSLAASTTSTVPDYLPADWVTTFR